ncbi:MULTISPECIES: response regulator [unclassified Caulobacter]|jgi:DNA-binding response OmpR family regulator|uniref:response regulator n=1 Tax=unclassified Caulobacter TaxID=2648921 RepID=UPI00143C70A7|nr:MULTISPECIES: response regulator [unclassified Caulobacter]MBQ1562794.1 response regulator [Caulobacter sp.]
MRLLIVEDDAALAEALGEALETARIASDKAQTAADAIQMLDATRYVAVILDLGLPDGDGRALLRRLRARKDPIPVLILTARGDLKDRVEGLDAGADDYLTKPFAFDELLARLRAVLRRKGDFQGSDLGFADLSFDVHSRELWVGDAQLLLSPREGELMELLIRRAGQVVSRQLAEDQLFGMSNTLGSNAVEVYIHRLRRKLEDAGAIARIENIRGVGYLLRGEA